MAKAIFVRAFHYTSRSVNAGWSAYPDPLPQTFPREFIAAAIERGAAIPAPPAKPLTDQRAPISRPLGKAATKRATARTTKPYKGA